MTLASYLVWFLATPFDLLMLFIGIFGWYGIIKMNEPQAVNPAFVGTILFIATTGLILTYFGVLTT